MHRDEPPGMVIAKRFMPFLSVNCGDSHYAHLAIALSCASQGVRDQRVVSPRFDLPPASEDAVEERKGQEQEAGH
jgi:hypothetical protein